jgi:hypothetical protein
LCQVTPVILHGVVSSHSGHPTRGCVKSLESSYTGLCQVTPVILHGVVSSHSSHPTRGRIPRILARQKARRGRGSDIGAIGTGIGAIGAINWFSQYGQFTRIGHIPGGWRPLLRQVGPICYEPRLSPCSCTLEPLTSALQPFESRAMELKSAENTHSHSPTLTHSLSLTRNHSHLLSITMLEPLTSALEPLAMESRSAEKVGAPPGLLHLRKTHPPRTQL